MNIQSILKKANLLLSCFLVMSVFSQKSEILTNFDTKFHHALKLYNNKAYAGAQTLFTDISEKATRYQNIKTDADYYDAMCAIKLNQDDAEEKVLQFVKDHPYSSKKERIYLNIGNYYFVNRKASHALKWYNKVNPALLSEKDIDELDYKVGYTLLASNYLEDAKERFKKLLSHPAYGNDARYFYGYIAYRQENYGEAEDNLTAVSEQAVYKSKANYHLLDMAFKSGKFDKAVKVGENIFPTIEKKRKSEVAKIIGESYFNIGDFGKAVPYLNQYEGENGRWNNTDYYYLGYSYYKLGDYDAAIKTFNKIIDGNNKTAQNAYYHLGECYLKADKKTEALNAFKNASEMSFDEQITADAALNYAKLSYENGNPYLSVPEVLKEYLAKYPEHESSSEIRSLLITSYLHEQDYQGALDYLQQNGSSDNDELFNEVSLYRGMQLFNEKNYKKAHPYFAAATKSKNPIIENKGVYWMSECDYLLSKYNSALRYNNALKGFMSVSNSNIEEAKTLNYNIAYSNFKLRQYNEAATFFQKFIDQKLDDNDLNDDAYNRLGDSYFATKQYTKAIEAYASLINQGGAGSDYALYQKGMSNGLAGKKQEKITDLEKLVKDFEYSDLVDDALYQLGSTYTSQGNSKMANVTYDELLGKFPKSSYVPTVILRQGLLHYNKGENEKALEKFKTIVAEYPKSNEAKQAVTNARTVYVDTGNVDAYADWVKGIEFANVSDSDIDNTTFEAAENKFLENNTIAAINGFKNYLIRFPNGLNALKANFYLAQSYLKNDAKNDAVTHYTYVVEEPRNEFSETSLAKLAQLHLEKENWDKGIVLLERLENEGNNPQNLLFAQSNLMKGYYEKEAYVKAVSYAEKVLGKEKLDQTVEEDARIIIARSAIKTEDYITAEEYYTIVDENATGELKAETLYYKAFFLNDYKAYEDSNKEVQNLIANYSNYKYWGVKSYIIMAKNFYALKDAYQATYILENVIENFTQFRDLVEEATNELNKIKNNEAKTNASVNSK